MHDRNAGLVILAAVVGSWLAVGAVALLIVRVVEVVF